jgi:8-oxo-dGTP pyrophosphatase MutT (NUDIX family)
MKYQHKGRKKITSNQRFNVYFDHIEISNFLSIQDFLVVSPKNRIEDNIVGVTTLPILSEKKGLMHVWRHQFNKFMWQAPAGFIEEGESPQENAQRELFEETGFMAKKLTNIGKFCTDAGLVDGYISIFIANDLVRINEQINLEIGVSRIHWFEDLQLKALLKEKPEDFGSSTYLACKLAMENCYE